MEKMAGKERTYDNLTFRLDTATMEALRLGVRTEGTSLNGLANRQLQKYAEWDRLAGKMGYMVLRNRVIKELISRIPEEDLKALGKEQGAIEAREFITFNWQTVNMENFMRFVRAYAEHARLYEVEERNDGEHILVLFHRLSDKWSVYLEAFMTSALEDLLGVKAKIYRTDQTVSLSFRDPIPRRPSALAGTSP